MKVGDTVKISWFRDLAQYIVRIKQLDQNGIRGSWERKVTKNEWDSGSDFLFKWDCIAGVEPYVLESPKTYP